jgi:hypothetical protein
MDALFEFSVYTLLTSRLALRASATGEHCTPRDVAEAFSEALDMAVEIATIPREAWEATVSRSQSSSMPI